MEILLFKFTKKQNSTKIPNDSDGVAVHVDIKQNVMGGREGFSKDCFAVTPTFFVKGGLTPEKATCYNYCKAFGRYYFIRNAMVDISNAITLFCEVDALATLRVEISNTVARVLYSSSHGNAQIDDRRNGPTANAVVDWETAQLFNQSGDGTYVLNIIGISSDSNSTPFTVSYLCQDSVIAHAFADSMLNKNFLESLTRYMNNSQNYVVSMKWTPIELPLGLAGQPQNIMVADFDTQVLARPFTTRYYVISNIDVPIPKRYSDYRQSSKYVEYILHIPYCGTYKIPVSALKGETSISVTPVLDLLTGDLSVRITNSSNAILILAGGNAYSDLPTAVETGLAKNSLAVVGGGLVAGAALVTAGTAIAGAAEAGTAVAEVSRTAVGVAHLANGVQSAIGAVTHEMFELTRGGAISSAGGGIALPVLELVEIAHDSVYNPSDLQATRGLPLGRAYLLGNLSGYCQTEGAQVEADDYSEIIYIANKQMDAGFYIE